LLVDDHLPHWVLIGLELVGVGLIGVELVGVELVGVELVGVELLNRDGARGRLARHAVNPSMGARLGNPCLARSRQPPPRSIPFTLPDSGSAGFPGFTVLVRLEAAHAFPAVPPCLVLDSWCGPTARNPTRPGAKCCYAPSIGLLRLSCYNPRPFYRPLLSIATQKRIDEY
jgi:hypothetical protein